MSGKQLIKLIPKTRLVRAYYIVNPNKDGIYVGSTVKTLNARMRVHEYEAKKCPDRKLYKECGGIENCEIHLIEETEIPLPNFRKNKDVFEQGWIEAINPCWNTCSAYEPDKSKRVMKYKQSAKGKETMRLAQQRYKERKRLAKNQKM